MLLQEGGASGFRFGLFYWSSLVQVTYWSVNLKLCLSQLFRSKAPLCFQENLLAAGRGLLPLGEGPIAHVCPCRGRVETMSVLCRHPASHSHCLLLSSLFPVKYKQWCKQDKLGGGGCQEKSVIVEGVHASGLWVAGLGTVMVGGRFCTEPPLSSSSPQVFP